MNKSISFLLGSGFSIPEGIPGMKSMNDRLSKIEPEDIVIHTDENVWFHDKTKDYTYAHVREDERLFVSEFLKFYNEQILAEGESFNYEEFYDFIAYYRRKEQNKEPIESFWLEFQGKYRSEPGHLLNCDYMMGRLEDIFQKLIEAWLHQGKEYSVNYNENIGISFYAPYDDFIHFLATLLGKQLNINVHTLNHDLLFEFMCNNHSSLPKCSDGFELEGSPFYGKYYGLINDIHRSFYIKTPVFTNQFKAPLKLFKLHGSVGTLRTPIERIKQAFGVHDTHYYEELKTEDGYQFKSPIVRTDFLSGTTFKMAFYQKDDYYKTLLTHFKENLSSDNCLIVIGYGFKDEGINKYIRESFTSKSNHNLIVIDPFLKAEDIKKAIGECNLELISKSIAPSNNSTIPAMHQKHFNHILAKL